MFTYHCHLIRCVDGDTFDADVDLGFRTFQRVRFRLLNVDTPERGEPGFEAATSKLEELLRESANQDGTITVKSRKTGKYGRWLAAIDHPSMREVGRILHGWMVEEGFLTESN